MDTYYSKIDGDLFGTWYACARGDRSYNTPHSRIRYSPECLADPPRNRHNILFWHKIPNEKTMKMMRKYRIMLSAPRLNVFIDFISQMRNTGTWHANSVRPYGANALPATHPCRNHLKYKYPIRKSRPQFSTLDHWTDMRLYRCKFTSLCFVRHHQSKYVSILPLSSFYSPSSPGCNSIFVLSFTHTTWFLTSSCLSTIRVPRAMRSKLRKREMKRQPYHHHNR